MTEYEIAPFRVVKQKKQFNAVRPGETTHIVIRKPGGTLIEGGYHLSTSVDAYPESETFRAGEDVVVFLQYRTDTKVYGFTGGPFGAFRLVDGRVQPMTREVIQRRGDKPVALAAFLDGLQQPLAR